MFNLENLFVSFKYTGSHCPWKPLINLSGKGVCVCEGGEIDKLHVMSDGCTQLGECLGSIYEALDSDPSTPPWM